MKIRKFETIYNLTMKDFKDRQEDEHYSFMHHFVILILNDMDENLTSEKRKYIIKCYKWNLQQYFINKQVQEYKTLKDLYRDTYHSLTEQHI